MAKYKLTFPRWKEDIVSMRRTLLHLPSTPNDVIPRVGDLIITVPELEAKEGVVVEVAEVSQALLGDDRDWRLLNLAAEPGLRSVSEREYRARWDAVNPDVPWESNPTVWRIVFRYLEGVELLTAVADIQRTS